MRYNLLWIMPVDISQLFAREIKPSLGCTEPVAIGYATSLAYNAILGRIPNWLKGKIPITYVTDLYPQDVEIDKIEISLSQGIFKNSLAVGIPRAEGDKGIAIAAAMGIFSFPQEEGEELALFHTIKPEDMDKAKLLTTKVSIHLLGKQEKSSNIQIRSLVQATHKHDSGRTFSGTATIAETHSNVTSLHTQDSLGHIAKIPYGKKATVTERNNDIIESLKAMTVSELTAAINNLPDSVTEKMLEMIEMNMAISEEGLRRPRGLKIGANLNALMSEGYLGNDLITSAQIMLASASDIRMNGSDFPVMSCAGSGNQGLTASLPLIAVAQKYNYNVKELLRKQHGGHLSATDKTKLNKLIKALALSNIITCYMTYHTGYLSALCGCAIKAGIGATAGIAYLLTESTKCVEDAIQNMAGNVTGIICDGGKEGCSLKLTTAASAAIQSALLSTKGVQIPSDNGIIGKNVEETIHNIGRICHSMKAADDEIIQVMIEKTS